MQRGPGILTILLVGGTFLLQRPTLATETDTAVPSRLHLATQAGDLAQVRRLLDSGQQVDATDDRGMTALHVAAATGNTTIASLLLDRGADPNARAAVQMTPLHFASMLGRAETAGLLARRGGRTDAQNQGGSSPLHLAADDKVVNVLVTAGASLTAQDRHGATPLHTARQSIVARALLDRGADMRMRNDRGLTAMEIAAVESLEPAGLSLHSLILGRLRGILGAMPLTLTNISSTALRSMELSTRSPACDSEANPSRIDSLLPGQAVDVLLSFTRNPTAAEGEHPLFVSISVEGRKLGEVDLRIDTRTKETAADRGMIRLAKGQMRPAPSRWYYLIYGAAPLLVVAAWMFLRRR
jgi:ankyrin repeat protein